MAIYKALFDADGERITTYVEGVHFTITTVKGVTTITPELPSGVIDISEDELNLYITGLYVRSVTNGKPVLRQDNIETVYKNKLDEFDKDSANAYVNGFYSTASGTKMYYDSDVETQKLLSNILNRTKEDDWETKERYPGMAPAGFAPVRARPDENSSNDEKTVNVLNAAQIKQLLDDLDASFWAIKCKLWTKQAEAKQYYENDNINSLKAMVW